SRAGGRVREADRGVSRRNAEARPGLAAAALGYIRAASMLGVSGKDRLDQRLGGGGMAEVFLGSTVGAEGFSRKVAIKRVLPGFSDNPAFAQMFVSHAQTRARLAHPHHGSAR